MPEALIRRQDRTRKAVLLKILQLLVLLQPLAYDPDQLGGTLVQARGHTLQSRGYIFCQTRCEDPGTLSTVRSCPWLLGVRRLLHLSPTISMMGRLRGSSWTPPSHFGPRTPLRSRDRLMSEGGQVHLTGREDLAGCCAGKTEQQFGHADDHQGATAQKMGKKVKRRREPTMRNFPNQGTSFYRLGMQEAPVQRMGPVRHPGPLPGALGKQNGLVWALLGRPKTSFPLVLLSVLPKKTLHFAFSLLAMLELFIRNTVSQVLFLNFLLNDLDLHGRQQGRHHRQHPSLCSQLDLCPSSPCITLSDRTPIHTLRPKSCSGPKSRGYCVSASRLFFCLVIASQVWTGTAVADARVSGLPTGSLGVAPPATGGSTKCSGLSGDTLRAADLPAARKRSFRRALRRASIHGSTRYRGRTFTFSEFERLRLPSKHNVSSNSQRPPNTGLRMRVLSVNFDGMTSAIYDSLQLWLATAPFDVLLMQETHRGLGASYNEWKAGDWYFVSSPDNKTRYAGVAIAVRHRLASSYDIRSLEVVPGRLLHVRLSGKLYSIDLISCYQHVINSKDSPQLNASRREQIWTKLGGYVAGLPLRNILLLSGDFSCAARREPGVAGFAAPTANSYYFDQDEFVNLAKANNLCFLNTWSRNRSHGMHTFANAQSRSQIDYILTRRSMADSLSRQPQPVPSLNFSPWRLGARHLPVQASIPLKPGWLTHKPRTQPLPGYNRDELEQSIHKMDHKAQQLVSLVGASLQQLPQYTADSLNQLLDSCVAIYPAGPKPPVLRPWQQPDVQTSVRDMWERRAELRRVGHNVRIGLFSRRQVFEAFRAFARFQRSYQELRRRGHWHRKQILLDQLNIAQQAETSRDVRSLYQVIRTISPKTQGGKVRIRSGEGALLTPEKEHAEITDFFFSLYDGHRPDVEPEARLDPVVLETNEIVRSLGKLGSGRAVPLGHAPSSAWKACRMVLGEPLREAFQIETMAGFPAFGRTASSP